MTWVSVLKTILYVTLYPLIVLLGWGYGLLRAIVVFPLVRLGGWVLHVVLLPLRLLAKFEAILSFLAVAVLTGIVLGVVQYYVTRITVNTLHRWAGYIWNTVFRRRREPAQKSAGSSSPNDNDSRSSNESDYANGGDGCDESFSAWDMGHKPWLPKDKDVGLLSSTILEEEEFSQESSASAS
ncbi:hypothetical protein BO70DRAFT_429044 [Aspergillus heteromorphus CBS 117.55]|uniref:Uncharacterized protein n=1 Tax=Aspergillus heteromorphus CBS 117.55 TaxID=1448321 RepID=A0A317W8Q4_9EURO|nr:uncharacterized protein BO70DRAFT_429044 [Aspergillus heteromorphus CBS 117.55]PWY82986.1 hypothetical protein BO70DRAFT_429044 [Aspergillus heteromorphus CBS 117.55]